MPEIAPRIYVGDCVEVMRKMKAGCIDAIVTDPPYGLEFMGKEWDSFGKPSGFDKRTREKSGAVKDAYARTLDRAPAKYVAGHAFQEWCLTWATEALRILKPGGFIAAFGGTRTYHRLACAIEDAGFEMRDSIGVLMWVYGSGFPKSLDVAKAIDKKAGVEREDKFEGSFNRRAGPTGNKKCDTCGKWLVSGSPCKCPRPQDAAVSEDAQRWQGYGTALKPAWEPVVLARKPLEGTVAENVLKYGTGALNIDGTRIGIEARHNPPVGAHINAMMPYAGKDGDGTDVVGRWPANVALVHAPDCGEATEYNVFAGEEVTVWNCVPDCPVTLLDAQSGERQSRAGASKGGPGAKNTYGDYAENGNVNYSQDTGGASRFFYTAKASGSERHAGGRVENKHPTVKPVELMQWLIRLVCPENGLVLDPFTGSGSTLVAAFKERHPYVGIEKDPDSANTAYERLGRKPKMIVVP